MKEAETADPATEDWPRVDSGYFGDNRHVFSEHATSHLPQRSESEEMGVWGV